MARAEQRLGGKSQAYRGMDFWHLSHTHSVKCHSSSADTAEAGVSRIPPLQISFFERLNVWVVLRYAPYEYAGGEAFIIGLSYYIMIR